MSWGDGELVRRLFRFHFERTLLLSRRRDIQMNPPFAMTTFSTKLDLVDQQNNIHSLISVECIFAMWWVRWLKTRVNNVAHVIFSSYFFYLQLLNCFEKYFSIDSHEMSKSHFSKRKRHSDRNYLPLKQLSDLIKDFVFNTYRVNSFLFFMFSSFTRTENWVKFTRKSSIYCWNVKKKSIKLFRHSFLWLSRWFLRVIRFNI